MPPGSGRRRRGSVEAMFAELSTDTVIVVVGVVFGIAALGLAAVAGVVAGRLRAELAAAEKSRERVEAACRRAEAALDSIEGRAGELVDELDAAVDDARLAATTIDQRARGAYRAIAEPVIRGAAVASGSRRALSRFRHPE